MLRADRSVKFVFPALVVSAVVVSSCSSPSVNSLRVDAAKASARGDCTAVIADLKAVLLGDPSDVVSLDTIANCQRELGEYGDAIASLKQAVRFSPSFQTWYQLAQAYWSNGDQSSAWKAMRSAAEYAVAPNDLIQAASAQVSYGDYGGCEATLGKISASDRNYLWYATSGMVETAVGTASQADSAFATAVSISPAGAIGSMYSAWGDSLIQRQDFSQAVVEYDAALNSRGLSPSQLVHIDTQLASGYESLNEYSNAQGALAKALSINQDPTQKPSIEFSLAQVDIELGQLEAARTLVTLIDHDPDTPASLRTQANDLLSAP